MKIGILSFAHLHAAGYAACLQQVPGVALAGIYDEDSRRGEEMAGRYGTLYFESVQGLLHLGLDGAIICSENAKHLPLVEKVAGQTKAILCEKPLATTIADAQSIIDICADRDTRLQIAFPVRFSPPIKRLKETLDMGSLGQVFSAKCTNHGSMPGGWFTNETLAGGGAVIDHTVHVIDVLRWLFDTEVIEVFAEVGESLLHPDLGIDDVGLISFALENGIYGTLDTSWSRPSSYPTWGDVKIDILGQNGLLQVNAFRQDLAVSSDEAGKTNWVPWGSNSNLGLIKDFVAMIGHDREPSITGNDGLQALRVALAAYESSRTRQPIELSH